jgi:hypothetical protein
MAFPCDALLFFDLVGIPDRRKCDSMMNRFGAADQNFWFATFESSIGESA